MSLSYTNLWGSPCKWFDFDDSQILHGLEVLVFDSRRDVRTAAIDKLFECLTSQIDDFDNDTLLMVFNGVIVGTRWLSLTHIVRYYLPCLTICCICWRLVTGHPPLRLRGVPPSRVSPAVSLCNFMEYICILTRTLSKVHGLYILLFIYVAIRLCNFYISNYFLHQWVPLPFFCSGTCLSAVSALTRLVDKRFDRLGFLLPQVRIADVEEFFLVFFRRYLLYWEPVYITRVKLLLGLVSGRICSFGAHKLIDRISSNFNCTCEVFLGRPPRFVVSHGISSRGYHNEESGSRNLY